VKHARRSVLPAVAVNGIVTELGVPPKLPVAWPPLTWAT